MLLCWNKWVSVAGSREPEQNSDDAGSHQCDIDCDASEERATFAAERGSRQLASRTDEHSASDGYGRLVPVAFPL